jgi:GT2 family glycosyltransferase
MKTLVGIPTLTRADLLIRNKAFLEGLVRPDAALIIDNGGQKIDIDVAIARPWKNLGVAGSWNRILRTAFVDGDFEAVVLLQDDIIWDANHLETAKHLVRTEPNVDLFLSHFQFAVQVHRASNLRTIGYYDERYFPAYCEDDDYALTMIQRGRIYQRFVGLDPLPGSISEGTVKSVPWTEQKAKLRAKWGRDFGVNDGAAPYYLTNRGVKGVL